MWQDTTAMETADSDFVHGALWPRTESARDKIALRYLREWISEYKPAFLERPAFPIDNSQPMPQPEKCGDASLTAFAQLAALRFGVRRCLISIITTKTEYVLTEATRSISLAYDCTEDPLDAPWIGTGCFPTKDGINYGQMQAWRKARRLREMPQGEGYYYKDGSSGHHCLISDARDREEMQNLPFAQFGKHHRFVFSVPLRDSKGTPLGALTLLDERPRFGISASEMSLAEDLADTIVRHMDSIVVRAQRQRGERLIQGLGVFNNDKDSLREWWSNQDDERRRKSGRYQTLSLSNRDARRARADQEFGMQEGSASVEVTARLSAVQDLPAAKIATRDFENKANATATRPKMTREFATVVLNPPSTITFSPVAVAAKKYPAAVAAKRDFDIVKEVAMTYARACNLLRESLDVEGVIFLDGSTISARHAKRNTQGSRFKSGVESRSSATSSVSGTEHPNTSDTDHAMDDGGAAPPLSRVCGYSTRVDFHPPSDPNLEVKISQAFLAHLVKSYPRGKVWNLTEDGTAYQDTSGEELTTTTSSGVSGVERSKPRSREQRDAEKLASMLSGARAIVLYPLFDSTNDRWRSCGLVWSTTQDRLFDPSEDLQYMGAFGACIVNKLSQLESVAADRTKSAFIGSISHELRSPLHGILAGVEFLQDSELTTFQLEMANTISMAGRTLLDTVNHILDYSKVTSFTRAQRAERAANDGVRHKAHAGEGNPGEVGVTMDVDLARMTEDVCESVISAFRFRDRISSTIAPIYEEGNPQSPISEDSSVQSSSGKYNAEIAVVLNIDRAASWFVTVSSGSWTRVLTNLVGNALKYTTEGSIQVSLECISAPHTSEDDLSRIRLTVKDTGVGISRTFLDHDLYTPFKQEDSHATGTGLGLSIVKQICRDMRADLRFESEKGRGTCAIVEFMLPLATQPPPESSQYDALLDIGPRRMHICSRMTQSIGTPRSKNVHLIEESVRKTDSQWLNWSSSTGPDVADVSKPTIYAIAESELHDWMIQDPDSLNRNFSALAARGTYMLVLASRFQSTYCEHSLPIRSCYVPQPIGPSKLARIVRAAETTDWAITGSQRRGGAHSQLSYKSGQSQRISSSAAPSPLWPLGQGKPGYFPEAAHMRAPSDAVDSKRGTEPNSLCSSEPMTPAALQVIEKELGLQQGRTKVLLVEDNSINMRLLVALCRKLKFEYFTAENGKLAVEKYTQVHSTLFLVLTDLNMPTLDGVGAARQIREFEKKHKLPRCNITALTGVTDLTAKQDAKAAGIDRFLTKPISMKDLRALIEDLRGGLAVKPDLDKLGS